MGKISKAEKHIYLAEAIERKKGTEMPGFALPMYVMTTESGEREILREIEGRPSVVQYYSDKGVMADILSYTREEAQTDERFNTFTYSQARDAGLDWINSSKPIEKPAMVRNKTEPGLCFHRLPFDPDIFCQTPLFDEFLARTSDPKAFKCFIGSLFHADADRQQYLWMFGEGQNGKGAMQRFMGALMGPAYISKVPPESNDKFWTSTLMGKRLVALPDCNDSKFPASGTFKMLTGEDQVPVERKRKDGYSVELHCKFVFGSNEKPRISSQKSDMRRAIYIEIDPIAGEPDPQYNTKLWGEAPGIVADCLAAYDEFVGSKHGPIPINDEKLKDLVGENEQECDAIFERYFDKDEPDQSGGENWFTGAECLDLFRSIYNGLADTKHRKFTKWLRTEHQITRRSKAITIGKEGQEQSRKVYIGAKRNTVWPMKRKESGENTEAEVGKNTE